MFRIDLTTLSSPGVFAVEDSPLTTDQDTGLRPTVSPPSPVCEPGLQGQ